MTKPIMRLPSRSRRQVLRDGNGLLTTGLSTMVELCIRPRTVSINFEAKFSGGQGQNGARTMARVFAR